MKNVTLIIGVLLVGVLLFGCLQSGPSQESVKADYTTYSGIVQKDYNDLNVIINEGSKIIDYYNTDLKNIEGTFTIQPKADGFRNVSLKQSYILSGTIGVSGGANNDVDFALSNAQGNELIAKKRISNTYPLSFTVPSDGMYKIYLGNMFSTFSPKDVTLSLTPSSRYEYYKQYINWADKYANKVELIQSHLSTYETFVKENENSLKSAGYNTVQLSSGITDDKLKLNQSITGVQKTITDMRSYFEQLQALQEQERQQTAAIIDILVKVLPLLG